MVHHMNTCRDCHVSLITRNSSLTVNKFLTTSEDKVIIHLSDSFVANDTTLLSSCWLYRPIWDRHYTWQQGSIHWHSRCIKIHPEIDMFSVSKKQHLNFEHFLSILEDRVILHFRHTVGGYVTADCRVTVTYTLKLVIDIYTLRLSSHQWHSSCIK